MDSNNLTSTAYAEELFSLLVLSRTNLPVNGLEIELRPCQKPSFGLKAKALLRQKIYKAAARFGEMKSM